MKKVGVILQITSLLRIYSWSICVFFSFPIRETSKLLSHNVIDSNFMEKIAEEQKSERVNANNSVLFHMILFKRGIPKQVQSESRLIEIAYALLRINRRCF